MKNVYSEDGKILTLEDINNQIYENLRPLLTHQMQKKEANMYLKKPMPLKFGATITNKLLELFRGYGLMQDEDLTTLSADDLSQYYLAFMSLINKISEDIEITPTKPLFCAYMGISTKIFNKLAKSDNDGIRHWIDAINGDFTHSMFDSALNGNADNKVALSYVSTKDYGQETVQNDFSATITTKNEVDYTPAQAVEFTKKIVALIENKKKNK